MPLTFATTQLYSSGITNFTAMHTFALVCVTPEESKCDNTMVLADGKASAKAMVSNWHLEGEI